MRRGRVLAAGALGAALAAMPVLLGGDRDEAPAPRLALQGDAPAVAYHAARIHVDGAQVIEDGYLVVQGGRVVGATDAGGLPPMVPVKDLGDAVIVPGLVAADSTVTGAGGQGEHSLGAHRRAFDSFDPWADMSKVLERGITTVYLSPARGRLIGGRGAVVKTAGEDRVLARVGDLRVDLTPAAHHPPDFFRPPIPPTSENPIEPSEVQPPQTHPGALLALREAHARATAEELPADPADAALAHFLQSPAPLRVAAERVHEVASAADLAAAWDKPLVVDGATGAGDDDALLARLQEQRALAVFEVPLFLNAVALPPDWQRPEPDTAARLARHVPVAVKSGEQGRWTWLLEAAAAAVGYGLTEEQALAAITEVPAQVLGVDERVGTLRPGRDADFVVMDGAPLDPASSVRSTWIAGRRAWSRDALPQEDPHAPVVLRAGTLWTGDAPPLTGGAEVLLQDGRIVDAGRSVPHPPGARIVDAGAEAHLTPGFVDARGTLGTGGARNLPDRVSLPDLLSGALYVEAWRAVASSGVTSMVVGPTSIPDSGARASLVKTAAAGPDGAGLRDRYVVWFDFRVRDHAQGAEGVRKQLARGKKYFEKWEEYRKKRAEWEKEDAAKQSGERAEREKALRIRLAQGAKPKSDEDAAEEEGAGEDGDEEEEEEEKEVDPINGLWEATIVHEMLPEPVRIEMRLFHEGTALTMILSSPDDPSGETLELEGTFENGEIRVELPTDFGVVVFTGVLTAPDTLECRVELEGMGAADFVATRTEVDEGGAIKRRRRLKKDDGPQPPRTDWNLEGIRALHEGRAVAVLAAERADEIRMAVATFEEAGLPYHLMGAGDALEVQELLRERGVGVVVDAQVIQREENRDVVPAARLRAAGIPAIFQSSASGAARFLPDVVTMATRHGLGAGQALRALTADAADILGVSDRVGRIAAGLDADVVVHSGPPFDLRSRVLHVFVNGREVPQP